MLGVEAIASFGWSETRRFAGGCGTTAGVCCGAVVFLIDDDLRGKGDSRIRWLLTMLLALERCSCTEFSDRTVF
jgi:hypothetical protein